MVNVCLRESPDGNCTNFAAMPDGAGCGSGGGMNGMIQDWDVSGVVDMTSMFHYAKDFNGDVSNWDVSAVTSMSTTYSVSVRVRA